MDSTLRLQSNRLRTHGSLATTLGQKRQQWRNQLALLQPESSWFKRLSRITAFTMQHMQHYTQFPILLHQHLPYSWQPLALEFSPVLPWMDFTRLIQPAFTSGRSPLPETKQTTNWVNVNYQEQQGRSPHFPSLSSLPQPQGLGQREFRDQDISRSSIPYHRRLIFRFQRNFPLTRSPYESILPGLVQPQLSFLSRAVLFPLSKQQSPASPSPTRQLPGSPILRFPDSRIRPLSNSPTPTADNLSIPPLLYPPTSAPPPLRLASGFSLDPELRSRLEPLMGIHLGNVRLHTDSTAASLAFRLRANAFTVGQRIFFAAGKFQPQTQTKLTLLIHELTHVRQQSGGQPLQAGRLTVTQQQTLEREAHEQEHAVLAAVPEIAGRSEIFAPRFPSQTIRQIGQPTAPSTPDPIAVASLGNAAFPPLLLSLASRTTAVVPLRQESTTTATPPVPVPSPTATPTSSSSGAPDLEKLSQQVYEILQRRLRIEHEQRGIQRWY